MDQHGELYKEKDDKKLADSEIISMALEDAIGYGVLYNEFVWLACWRRYD